MGRQLSGLRGAGKAGWQAAQPIQTSRPLHLSREFSSFWLLPAQCGRSRAEKRTPAGSLKRKRICEGRGKGVFSSQKFPNLSVFLQLYDCSPPGDTFRVHAFPIAPEQFIHFQQLQAGADLSWSLLTFSDIQAPSHRAAKGMQPRT